MGQGSSHLNWTCTCEDGKLNISATYQEVPQEDQQQSQNRHQGVSRSVPTRATGVRKETLMPIIDDEMQDETGKGPAMSKKGSSTGMRRTFSSYELAQPRPSNAPAKRTPTTQVPKQYRSHEVLSSNSSAANTTESSGLSQSNSENSLHSSKSADSKLQRFIGLSNASKARQQQQTESNSRKSSIVNGLPTERKSSLNSSTASTVSTTDRKSSVGDVDSLTELLKKKKKDARRAEIVANVTRRLYNTKKPEPKPEPVIEPPKPPQAEEDDVEPEELKLCMRARLQALSKRALSIHRGRRKGVDVEAQTDFPQQVLRVKEVAISTSDIFPEEFLLGYQVYDNYQKQHLYLSDQAAWITFTRLFDPYREFYNYPSMRGRNNIWGNFHREPKITKTISSDDAFSDDSLEEIQTKQEEHSQPKVCDIISFASGDRFAPHEDSRTCSTQTDCTSICNDKHSPLPMETNHCHCKKATPEVQVTLFNGLPFAGSDESQASVDDGYSSSNKEDEEVNINNSDSPMVEIPEVDRMLYTITENSEQNSDCNEMLSMENIDISKPSMEIPSAKVLSDKVVQASPDVLSLCYCKLHNNGTTFCSIKLNECLSNTSCNKVMQVSGYCDLCFYKGSNICSCQQFASSDVLPVSKCCLCMCPYDKKLVPTLCSCAVQCSLDKENLKNKITQTNIDLQRSYCDYGSTGTHYSKSMCSNRQTDALLCEICSRRIPPDKPAQNENGKQLNCCCLCNNQCLDCLSGKKNADTVLMADAGTNTSRDLLMPPKLQNQLPLLFGIPQAMKMSTLQYEDSIAFFFGSANSQPTMVRLVTRESVGIQTDSRNTYHCISPPPQLVSVVESTEYYTPKTNNNIEHNWKQPSASVATSPLLPEATHSTEEDRVENDYLNNNGSEEDSSLDDFSDEEDMPSLPRTSILPPEPDDSQNWSEMKNLILGRNKNLFPLYDLSIEQDLNLSQRPQKNKSVSWSDLSGCGALHTEMVFDECLFDSSQPSVSNPQQRSIQEEDVPELKRTQPNEANALLRSVSKRRQIKKLCDMPRRSWSVLDMKDLLRKQIKSEQQLSAFLHEATTLIQNLSQATMNHNEANINAINSNINTSFKSFLSPPRCGLANNSTLLDRCSNGNYFPISKASKEHFNKDSRNLFPCRVYQKYGSENSGQWNTQHPNGNCNLNLQEYDNLDNRYEVSEEMNHYWHCHCQFVVPQKTFRNSPKAYMKHLVAIRRQIIQATSSSVRH